MRARCTPLAELASKPPSLTPLCSSSAPPGFYELFNGPGDKGKIVPLRDSLAYKLDYLGLKVGCGLLFCSMSQARPLEPVSLADPLQPLSPAFLDAGHERPSEHCDRHPGRVPRPPCSVRWRTRGRRRARSTLTLRHTHHAALVPAPLPFLSFPSRTNACKSTFDKYSLPILKQTFADLEAKRAERRAKETITATLVVN